MEIVLVLLPLWSIGYMIMFFKDKGDMFYIKKKEMVHSISQEVYLKQEIRELEDELELADYQGVSTVIIEEIKKELKIKKDRLSFIINGQ